MVMYRRDPDLVVLAECKSGKNLQEAQARAYQAADADSLRRAGTLPRAFAKDAVVPVVALFVALESHRADVESCMAHLGVRSPLLTVGRERVRLSGTDGVAGLSDFDLVGEYGNPPARIPIDYQSPEDETKELVVPRLMAATARREEYVEVNELCRDLLPEWCILSHSGRREFIRRIEQILRGVCASDLKEYCRFEPQSNQIPSRVVILGTPAALDPRGATQAWQARQRRAAKLLGRTRTPHVEGQLSLDDLAGAGGLATE